MRDDADDGDSMSAAVAALRAERIWPATIQLNNCNDTTYLTHRRKHRHITSLGDSPSNGHNTGPRGWSPLVLCLGGSAFPRKPPRRGVHAIKNTVRQRTAPQPVVSRPLPPQLPQDWLSCS
jgi:hypothetical protein